MNPYHIDRRRFLAFTTAAVALPAAARAQTGDLVRIGAIPFDNAGEVFYARQLGTFAKAGLSVEITPMTSGAAITAGVASGALDIGFSNLLSVTTAYSRGIPLVAIAPAALQQTGMGSDAIIVAKDAPYHTGKDLNGKTLGVDGLKGLTDISMEAWIDKNGGDSSTVKVVEVPEPAMGAALAQGRIDAASLQLTNVDFGPASAVRVLADPYEAIGPRFTPSVWFTTRAWLAAHRDEAARFATVMRDTARWANANHAASGEILAAVAKLTPERMNTLAAHRTPYAEMLDPRMIQPLIDIAARYGLIPKAFPAREIM